MRDASVKGGRLAFPSGMSYRVLVLPRFDTMTPPLLRKVSELVQASLTVVGARRRGDLRACRIIPSATQTCRRWRRSVGRVTRPGAARGQGQGDLG